MKDILHKVFSIFVAANLLIVPSAAGAVNLSVSADSYGSAQSVSSSPLSISQNTPVATSSTSASASSLNTQNAASSVSSAPSAQTSSSNISPSNTVSTSSSAALPSNSSPSISISQTNVTSKTSSNSSLPAYRALSRGMSGPDVTALQYKLVQLGYFNDVPSGYYGSLTQAAVIAYQKANTILQTGTVGPITYKAMYLVSSVGSGSSSASAKSISSATLAAGSTSFACPPSPTSLIHLGTPNGYEVYQDGDMVTVTWMSCNIPATDTVTIKLIYTDPASLLTTAHIMGTSVNDGTEKVNLPIPLSYFGMNFGMNFKVELGTSKAGDTSDNFFSIVPKCTATSSPWIRVLNPNGDPRGTLVFGSGVSSAPTTINAQWASCNQSGNVGVSFYDPSPSLGIMYDVEFAKPVTISAGFDSGLYSFPVPEDYLAWSSYKLRVYCHKLQSGIDTYCIDAASSDDFGDYTFGVIPTSKAPTLVKTVPAYSITRTSAYINGSGLSNVWGYDTWFEYGTTSSLGSSTPSAHTAIYGSGASSVNLTGLIPNTTYYYRFGMSNSSGTTYSSTSSFTTLP